MNIGVRVRTARDRLGLTREQLVEQMGEWRMEPNTLWYIESGRTKNPRADQIIALAKALNVSADYLLGLADEPTPPRRTRRPGQRKADAIGEEPALAGAWAIPRLDF